LLGNDPLCSKTELFEGTWKLSGRKITLSHIRHITSDTRVKEAGEDSIINETLDGTFELKINDACTHISGCIKNMSLEFEQLIDSTDLSIFS
jgi:hypothetical protein